MAKVEADMGELRARHLEPSVARLDERCLVRIRRGRRATRAPGAPPQRAVVASPLRAISVRELPTNSWLWSPAGGTSP